MSSQPSFRETKHCVCFGCATVSCAVQVAVEKNRIVAVLPDEGHPMSPGQLCPRLAKFPDVFYDPNRLNFPLKRVGKRGEGRWQQITWQQALDEIASKLKDIRKKYGAEAVATTIGTGRGTFVWAETRFCNLFGTPNRLPPWQICYLPTALADSVTYGVFTLWFGGDPRAKSLVAIGGTLSESTPLTWRVALSNLERDDFRLAVVDTRCTDPATKADVWLQIRPGTDCALLMSWLNVVIEEELYDKQFVEKWTNAPFLVRTDVPRLLMESDLVPGGSPDKFAIFDTASNSVKTYDPDTREYAPPTAKPALIGAYKVTLHSGETVDCKTVWQLLTERVREYTPEKAAKITWLPAHKIRDAARMYATNKPGWIHHGNKIEFGSNAFYTQQAKAILKAIVGNLDVPGGEVIVGPNPNMVKHTWYWMEENEKLSPEQKKKQLGADRFKLITWPGQQLMYKHALKVFGTNPNPTSWSYVGHPAIGWHAILEGKPYPIKAYICNSSNPLVEQPNPKMIYQALKSENLELFVAIDIFMTPTVMLADYVLPAAWWPERPEISASAATGVSNFVYIGERAVPASMPGQYDRRSDWWIYRELGVRLGQDWERWKTDEDVMNYYVEGFGMKADEFLKVQLAHSPPEKYGKYVETGFATPSGRAELYSSVIEKLGYDGLPRFVEPLESPVSTPMLAKKYPLILINGGRVLPYHHSEYRQVPSMRRMHPDPVVQIHPKVARQLGITPGDWVWIETPRGRCKQKASITLEVPEWAVHAEHGWWYPEKPGPDPSLFGVWDSNINVVTTHEPECCDPIVGTWPGTFLCRIEKAGE